MRVFSRKNLTAIALTAGIALVSSCSLGTKTGMTTLGFQATKAFSLTGKAISGSRAITPTPADIAIGNGLLRLTEAKIGVREIEFEIDLDTIPAAEQSAYATDEWEFAGPNTVDLLARTVSPALEPVVLPPGQYEEIEFKLATALDQGRSIMLAGTWYADKSNLVGGVPFSLVYDGIESVELKPSGEAVVPMTIEDTADNNILIAFRMDEWFSGIAMPAGSNIVIDKSTNATVLNAFMLNFAKSCDYGEDKDGDSVLSDVEDDD